LGALLLLLVEAAGVAVRSSYTRAVAGSNPAAPTSLTSGYAAPRYPQVPCVTRDVAQDYL
jgi:hypothetical protein